MDDSGDLGHKEQQVPLIDNSVSCCALLNTRGWYRAALVATAIPIPIVGALAGAIAYGVGGASLGNLALAVGAGCALVIWSLSALYCFLLGNTTAQGANADNFNELRTQAAQLCMRIGRTKITARPGADQDGIEIIARDLRCALGSATAGDDVARRGGQGTRVSRCPLRWVLAAGYLGLWGRFYDIDAALLLYESEDDVVRAAHLDARRLDGAKIHNVDILRANIRWAVGLLNPTALDAITPPVQGPAAATVPPVLCAVTVPATSDAPDQVKAARAILMNVRRAITSYRQERWQGLARARRRLMAVTFTAGLITCALLTFAIIERASSAAIIAACAFFLVGAAVGLINRLYLDGQDTSGVEDYGFTRARLMQTPLLSGMAALGGVLLAALLPLLLNVSLTQPAANGAATASFTPGAPVTGTIGAATPASITTLPAVTGASQRLDDIFSLDRYPAALLLAAVFGLTPGLLINRLSQQAATYKSEIKSSFVAE